MDTTKIARHLTGLTDRMITAAALELEQLPASSLEAAATHFGLDPARPRAELAAAVAARTFGRRET